jgi:hypothetical protein
MDTLDEVIKLYDELNNIKLQINNLKIETKYKILYSKNYDEKKKLHTQFKNNIIELKQILKQKQNILNKNINFIKTIITESENSNKQSNFNDNELLKLIDKYKRLTK